MFDLAELQALPLPRCSLEYISGPGLTDGYLSVFVPPRLNEQNDGVSCVGCGDSLWRSGMIGVLMGSTFTWGIVNGDGHCSTCGYPTRMLHRVPQGTITFPFQYHPDDLAGAESRSA